MAAQWLYQATSSDIHGRLLHHASHSSHTSHWVCLSFLVREGDDSGLGGDHQTGNTGGINQSGSDDLGWVDDTSLLHVSVDSSLGIESVTSILLLQKSFDDDGTFTAGVVSNSLAWDSESSLNDLDTVLLVEVGGLDVVEDLGSVEESATTT